jgi:hypothetical protein
MADIQAPERSHLLSLRFERGAMALIIAAGCLISRADAQLVTYFNFNDSNLASDGGQASTITSDFDPNVGFSAGTTLNALPGDPDGQALTLQNGTSGANNGRFIQFGFSTVGLTDLALSYATSRSSSGFTNQVFSYSTDGVSFTPFGAAVLPTTTTFGLASFDLSAVDAIENQASVTFRLTFSGGSTDIAIGTNRIDNIQVTAVPEPGTVFGAVVLLGLVGYRERRRLRPQLTLRAAGRGQSLS